MFLQFDGVGSAYWAWLNGRLVGYAQDTFLCSEFDVTEVLRPGINHLAVQVSPVCAGSPTGPAITRVRPSSMQPGEGHAAPDEQAADVSRGTDLELSAQRCCPVQVMRWSDGSYLEDQDHWWLSGIHRSECLKEPLQHADPHWLPPWPGRKHEQFKLHVCAQVPHIAAGFLCLILQGPSPQQHCCSYIEQGRVTR